MLNISYRRVGGLRFLKIGRLMLTFCVTEAYRPLKAARRVPTIVYHSPLFGPRPSQVEGAAAD
jgi:hypothetical protein